MVRDLSGWLFQALSGHWARPITYPDKPKKGSRSVYPEGLLDTCVCKRIQKVEISDSLSFMLVHAADFVTSRRTSMFQSEKKLKNRWYITLRLQTEYLFKIAWAGVSLFSTFTQRYNISQHEAALLFQPSSPRPMRSAQCGRRLWYPLYTKRKDARQTKGLRMWLLPLTVNWQHAELY